MKSKKIIMVKDDKWTKEGVAWLTSPVDPDEWLLKEKTKITKDEEKTLIDNIVLYVSGLFFLFLIGLPVIGMVAFIVKEIVK